MTYRHVLDRADNYIAYHIAYQLDRSSYLNMRTVLSTTQYY